MADAATRQLIDQIVQEQVQAGTMFTAYDITLEARKRGGNIRHGEARNIVHDVYQQGRMGAGYKCSVIDVGAPAKPFLYHRFSDDPGNYRSTTGATAQPMQSKSSPRQPGIVQRIVQKVFGGGQPQAGTRSPARTPTASVPARRPPVTLGLDADQFLPISRDELKSAAGGMRIWASPWFGRRDLIPPTDDERTKLIDRAMVTHGLLSPEQLAEIHRVGAEMDRLRPDPLALRHQAQKAGQAAVDEERAEKTKEKEKKKAEAAQRRQRRAEQIVHRRATDITYLGRGVSGRLGDRQSDPEKLASCDLAVLSAPADLAAALNITVSKLRWLKPGCKGKSRTSPCPARKRAIGLKRDWMHCCDASNVFCKRPAESLAVIGH